MMDPDIDSPAVMRYAAQLRDMGYSWSKVCDSIRKRFNLDVKEITLKRLYKRYSLARKEVVAKNPEFKKRIERDLMYALDKMDFLENEVEELKDEIKGKDNKTHSEYKIILECVDRIDGLLEKRIKLLKSMQPKEQKMLKGPTNLHLTQNIVNSLEELESTGAITINKGEPKNVIDVESMEVLGDGKEGKEDRSGREDNSDSPDGDDSGGVRPDEGHPGQRDREPEQAEGAVGGAGEESPGSGDHTGAPVVTVSATKTADLKSKIPVPETAEPSEGGSGEEGAGKEDV